MTDRQKDALKNLKQQTELLQHMREVDRIERILGLLREEWYKHPDTRLGQLVSNLAASAGWTGDDVFYVEDDMIEDELRARKLAGKLAQQVVDGTLGDDV